MGPLAVDPSSSPAISLIQLHSGGQHKRNGFAPSRPPLGPLPAALPFQKRPACLSGKRAGQARSGNRGSLEGAPEGSGPGQVCLQAAAREQGLGSPAHGRAPRAAWPAEAERRPGRELSSLRGRGERGWRRPGWRKVASAQHNPALAPAGAACKEEDADLLLARQKVPREPKGGGGAALRNASAAESLPGKLARALRCPNPAGSPSDSGSRVPIGRELQLPEFPAGSVRRASALT